MPAPRRDAGMRKPRSDKRASPVGKTKPNKSASLPMDFGVEGPNKTMPVPQSEAQPGEVLANTTTKHIEKSPYTRG